MNPPTTADLSTLLQAFFTDRMMRQRRASSHTIASYRDTFRLLLRFAKKQLGKSPSALLLDDLDAPFIGAFLNYLERERNIGARTRNLRLAAIRSFFHYAAYEAPTHAALIQRVLAIPSKRQSRSLVAFPTRSEVDALLDAPDRANWAGRRDHTLLLVAVQTGLRVSELVSLRRQDVVLGTGAHVRCLGKGRKERCTPIKKEVAATLAAWLREQDGGPAALVFQNARGGPLSVDGVQYILTKHVATARRSCPTLGTKRVSPHVLRHTKAMELLLAGIDRTLIALWLGHESVETTQVYVDANLAIKEDILAKTAPIDVPTGRYRPDDKLIAFLKSL